MSPEERECLLDDIENEGFDYALVYYRNYSFIKDEVFQEKYRAYLDARKDLENYIGVDE